MQNYIDSCKKVRAAYLEQNTLHFEDIANIATNSDSTIPKKKQNGRGKHFQ